VLHDEHSLVVDLEHLVDAGDVGMRDGRGLARAADETPAALAVGQAVAIDEAEDDRPVVRVVAGQVALADLAGLQTVLDAVVPDASRHGQRCSMSAAARSGIMISWWPMSE
jgi:hypothetical protein